MNNIQQAINAFLTANNSKQTIALRLVKDKVNEVTGGNHQQAAITEELKKMGYEVIKSSVSNPFYQVPGKAPAKHSSKSKAVIVSSLPQPATDQDVESAYSAAVQMIGQVVPAQIPAAEESKDVQEAPAVEESKEEVQTVNPEHFNILSECYQSLFSDAGLDYLTADLEYILTAIGKDSRIHRIRALITDQELNNQELKGNSTYQLLYSSVQTVKMFQTPSEKARGVHQTWLKKLVQLVNPQFSPQVQGVLDILKSL